MIPPAAGRLEEKESESREATWKATVVTQEKECGSLVEGEGAMVKMERCECIQGKLRIQKNKSE